MVSVAICRVDERTRRAVVVENDNTKSDVCKDLGLANPEQLISVGQVYLGEKARELMSKISPDMREVLAAFYMSGYVTGQAEKAQDISKRLGLE